MHLIRNQIGFHSAVPKGPPSYELEKVRNTDLSQSLVVVEAFTNHTEGLVQCAKVKDCAEVSILMKLHHQAMCSKWHLVMDIVTKLVHLIHKVIQVIENFHSSIPIKMLNEISHKQTQVAVGVMKLIIAGKCSFQVRTTRHQSLKGIVRLLN